MCLFRCAVGFATGLAIQGDTPILPLPKSAFNSYLSVVAVSPGSFFEPEAFLNRRPRSIPRIANSIWNFPSPQLSFFYSPAKPHSDGALQRVVTMTLASSSRRRSAKRARASGNGFLLKLELRSDPGLLCVVRGALERLTESLGFAAAECRSITRAVDEALTNIIRHCYSGDPTQPIEVCFKRLNSHPAPAAKDGIEILLWDHGPRIDPSKFSPRSLDEVRPGGLGLHLIRKSMDELDYHRVRGANRFRLVKYLVPAKQAPAS